MDYKDKTVAQLRALLDERGVGYPKKAVKAELVELLEQEDQPIEVEAVEIDDSIIPTNVLAVDVEAMQEAAISLTAALDEASTALGEFDVDDDTLSSMPMSDVRDCEGGIAAALKDVDARRKELTRLLTEPKKAIDAEVKKLTEPLSALAQRYADRRQEVYMEGYEAQYQECCIANGLEAMAQAVPFDSFIARHGQWVSRTANPVKTQEKIAAEVNRIAKDWETLRGLKGSMRFYDDAEACFFETLDLNAAINRNKERTAQQERIDAINREREENERWRRERAQEPPHTPVFEEVGPEPATMPEPPAEPARAPQGRPDGRRRYHFEAWMTDAELASFREWKNACRVGDGWTFRQVREVA